MTIRNVLRGVGLASMLAATALLATPLTAVGCGFDWRQPSQPFDGVDRTGAVSLWYRVAEVPLPGEPPLPLIIQFSSRRDSLSPNFGFGWRIPLLESRITQPDTNLFEMEDPSGGIVRFWRKAAEESTCVGEDGWMAEARGDEFTAWAACGWKLYYRGGKLLEITTAKDHRIKFIYVRDRLVEMRCGDVVCFKGEIDGAARQARAFQIGAQRYQFGLEQLPFGDGVSDGASKGPLSLASVGRVGTNEEFHFNFQKGDEGVAKLLVEANSARRELHWDLGSRNITFDTGWTYEVQRWEGLGGDAAITRYNAAGQTEYWYEDRRHAFGVTKRKEDDFVLETHYFSNRGAAASNVLWVDRVKGKTRETVETYKYDEGGRRLEEWHLDGREKRYVYDENGRLARIEETQSRKGGGIQIPRASDATPPKPVKPGKTVTVHTYDSKQREIERTEDGVLRRKCVWSADGRSVELTDFGNDGKTTLILTETFDGMGRVLSRITTFAGSGARPPRPIRDEYGYDNLGRLTSHRNSQDGEVRYSYTTQGERIATRILPQPEN